MKELHRLTLPRNATILVLVDIQERLFNAMDPERKDEVEKNTGLLISLAKLLRLPIMVTEQYPAGLGKTIPPVQEALPPDIQPFEKLIFSSWQAEGFAAQFHALAAQAAIVAGMESHVCVLGTALDMLKEGITVHVPRDAVISRTKENWQTGLELMDQAGAVVTSTETVIFQLLDRAGTDEFRAMSRLLR
jgi:nicotinamidase-related amidase